MIQGEHVKITVELLQLLARAGADVDLQKNNGEVALHTAARRGPLQAVWVLLFSKATHDIRDHRMFTPESAAARAGKKEAVALLANWSIARVKYLDSEFVHEWMHFLRDPDANLGQRLTATEMVGLIRMEAHEENTAVRARGGHTLIDETITGPIVPSKQGAEDPSANSSLDSVDAMSTLESGTRASNRSTSPALGEVRTRHVKYR